ncbi:MAG: amidohydrolase [Pseudomonadota bacterium]|uniref:5-methylthioadenosine/S-adenosylhomocysteine deaminase n=1 Tax=Candidatus Desulfatibia profunda TaxID=2841695 RepID=A0A8J6TKQ0_9BACT|nr:amidohydrolase [Candidatus Desulfatibia profunda]MBL7180019.1 amidohydrolase [Desulfobacterales bacterium]
MKFDIVIHNGTVVTVNPNFDIIKNGLVCIKDGTLARIEAGNGDLALPEAKDTIDAGGGIIMPGLVNTHTHLPMTLLRGLADDLPLTVWLNEHIFPAEGKHIGPETVRAGTLLACAEMILSGTTTCCDGYFFEDNVAAAVCETGLRAVLGQGVIDFPAPGVPNPADNVTNATKFVQKWRAESPLIRPSIFCHSPYTCSKETLQKAKDAADAQGVLFQIHAAETKTEYNQILSEQQASPVKYLDTIGILDRNTLLVHTVWLDDDDIEIIAGRKASVSHNPESNMKLASGIAPVPKLIKAGVAVGLGTDGCASNNDLDLFREMDTAAKLHKVNVLDPTVMDARTVLKMATIGGAKAIGLENDIGSLEVGKQADVVIIDVRKPHLVPMYNPVSQIVYAVGGSDVRNVIVSGKVLLRDRKLTTVDLEDILKQVAAIAAIIKP